MHDYSLIALCSCSHVHSQLTFNATCLPRSLIASARSGSVANNLCIYFYLSSRLSSFYQGYRDPSEVMTDNCVVNVFPIGDSLIAATEGNCVHQINSESLDSIGRASTMYTVYTSVSLW